MIEKTVRIGDRPTEEQIKRIREADAYPPVFDDDCPELTEEQMAMMAKAARLRREEAKKQVISIRISPETLEKAKATGRGYTGFLSRLLDNALNDPDLVRKSL